MCVYKPAIEWVKARAACSIDKVFQQLRLEIEHDVEQRNAMRDEYDKYGFDLTADNRIMTVSLRGSAAGSVTFRHTGRGIAVQKGSAQDIIEGVLTLNDQGECRLKVAGREREFWQFRRDALEALFFESAE